MRIRSNSSRLEERIDVNISAYTFSFILRLVMVCGSQSLQCTDLAYSSINANNTCEHVNSHAGGGGLLSHMCLHLN